MLPEEGPDDMTAGSIPDRARFLRATRSVISELAVEGTGPVVMPVSNSLAGYRSQWPVERVFPVAPEPAMRSIVEVSGELRRRGFQPPVMALADIATSKRSWQVDLIVECGQDGRPEHVFLERGSGNSAIDSALVREMYGAKLAATGTPCAGRVSVSLSRQ